MAPSKHQPRATTTTTVDNIDSLELVPTAEETEHTMTMSGATNGELPSIDEEEQERQALQDKLTKLEQSSLGSSESSLTVGGLGDKEQYPGDDMDDDGASHRTGSLGSITTAASMTIIGIPRHILASKWLVAAILVGSTATLGYFTYKYTSEEEDQEFKNQFQDYADEIIDQSLMNLVDTFQVLASFSKTITSLALFANASWPLVSVPHWETRASDFLVLSKASRVALAPLVSDNKREDWEGYAVANQDWIQEGLDFEYMAASTTSMADNSNTNSNMWKAKPIQETIWRLAPNAVVEISKGPHLPVWQTHAAPRTSYVVNFNLLSTPEFQELHEVATRDRHAGLSGIMITDNWVLSSLLGGGGDDDEVLLKPHSAVLQPIFKSFDDEEEAPIVAFLVATLPWNTILEGVLHDGADPIICVLSNSCGESYSYQVRGHEATFLGEGDWHNEKYEELGVSSNFTTADAAASSLFTSLCNFTLSVYPTEEMESDYHSTMPKYLTMAVIGVFAFTSLIFLLYDLMVQRQQSTLAATAVKTTAILGSLFPEAVHERLFASNLANDTSKKNSAPKFRMMKMANDDKPMGGQTGEHAKKDAPIADLFPECTVMFCDISGFTAWSSVREPTQVFQLLETVYNAFDVIANRRGVFKVETIGDSYLAVTGLPTPREDHAQAMVKFASDCLHKMRDLTKSLELELGPGTGDLAMRFGLHSGPVTAGVLRGEKTRFQLFGDTVNTASRMESTGERDKIQVSQETADLLIAAGREKWVKARDTKIMAKGKGQLQTYWACPRVTMTESQANFNESAVSKLSRPKLTHSSSASVRTLPGTVSSTIAASGLDERKKRSVHWISEIMMRLLKQIVARRSVAGWNIPHMKKSNATVSSCHLTARSEKLVIDELQDIITLPKFDRALARKQADASTVKLPQQALEQLQSYISEVALIYRDNPFHNIDHAAHVTMSVSKLLARIVAPESLDPAKESGRTFEARRHDHTYGITSDPLTQFACVFAALIHDADHPGCPNSSLVKEKTDLAVKYQNRSVAEQNSFDLCWDMLMEEQYRDLRACIYATEEEGKRFRQLVVNSIIATDISDKTLSAQRKARWNKAFHDMAAETKSNDSEHGSADKHLDDEQAVNRKATIVIEHLIQASDVAHTMQHWHIYMKWNEKLFQEMQKAYSEGRLEKDPAESWYQGELGFYDFYIIPLAKKLKECGVFGVSSAEYLNYATANRQEWEIRGQEVVAGYIKKYGKPPPPASHLSPDACPSSPTTSPTAAAKKPALSPLRRKSLKVLGI